MSRTPTVLSIVAGQKLSGSSGLLVRGPLDLLARDGFLIHNFRFSSNVERRDVLQADLVVFQKNQENFDVKLLDMAQFLKKPVVFHTDDDQLSLNPDMFKTRHFLYPHRLNNYKTFLARADLVHVSTEALAQASSRHTNRPIYVSEVLPNHPGLYEQPVKHSQDGIFRFVYAANPDNYTHLRKFAVPAIQKIMQTYGARVHFTFMGGSGLDWADPSLSRSLPWMSYEEFYHLFPTLTLDGALAPMDQSAFSLCKTDHKFREYAARGLAGIYSDSPIYKTVESGQTGLVVANTVDDWGRAMAWMIENRAEAAQMGHRARQFVESRFTMRRFADLWRDKVISPLLAGRIRPNPQTAGGRRRGRLYAQGPLYAVSRALDKGWRRVRTAYYDAFYLDRQPLIRKIKQALRR